MSYMAVVLTRRCSMYEQLTVSEDTKDEFRGYRRRLAVELDDDLSDNDLVRIMMDHTPPAEEMAELLESDDPGEAGGSNEVDEA